MKKDNLGRHAKNILVYDNTMQTKQKEGQLIFMLSF